MAKLVEGQYAVSSLTNWQIRGSSNDRLILRINVAGIWCDERMIAAALPISA
ncbi:MAG: hypothetical protein GX460_06975 [Firmicutes bacterium]|nr:hypothetical protein [Bacillota bacterium]